MKTVRACNVHIKIPIRPERIISLVLRGQQMMKFMHWILDDTRKEFVTHVLSSLK